MPVGVVVEVEVLVGEVLVEVVGSGGATAASWAATTSMRSSPRPLARSKPTPAVQQPTP